ncbi:right-handed parallel beta-helix repeat-containing protein, partial [Raoultella planticola]|uniref:right-handed parallel beta-helix repeat-containing protein n=1 Tax=Raoultella planticola TaxID=575 RepID=UPI003D0908E2
KKLTDAEDNILSLTDEDGKLYLPGLGSKSVQDSIKDIRAHYDHDRAPHIKKLTDAEDNILSLTDEDGKLYLPGLGSKSVQERFEQLTDLYNKQYKSKAIFDSWGDFQIDWNGNNSVAYQLQAAIDKVSALPYGGSIFISRPGVYLLHKYITARNNVTLRGVPGVVFMPMLQNSAFYYRYSAAYLENFNLIDIEIDGAEQHGSGYDVGAKGTYLQYFRNVLMLRCKVQNTGATGIGNDYPDRSFILDCVTDNCGRMAPDGVGGASGIGIGLGALQDEPLVIANAICRGSKNYGIFFEQQRLSGPGQPYVSRQITVANAVCTGNGYGFGDCGAGGLVIVNGQFNDNLKTGVNIDAGTLANNGIAPRPGKDGLMINCQIERNGVTGLHYDSTKIQTAGGYQFSNLHINENAQDGILLEAGDNTLADVRFDDMDIKDNGRYPVNVASGTFTDLDFTNLRMLRNGGNTAFKLDGNITRGTIHDCKLRSQNGAAAITGAGAISHFDIAENQYTDTNSNPINLTGTLTNVTYGRNPGIQE